MIIMEEFHQNCKFHDPQGRGYFATSWPYKSYSENVLYLWKASSLLLSIDQTNLIYSNDIDDQGRVYQNCKFHDPQGKGCFARAWPCKSFSENALFLWKSDKQKICNVVIMTKEGSTTILNFMTSGAGVFVLGVAI